MPLEKRVGMRSSTFLGMFFFKIHLFPIEREFKVPRWNVSSYTDSVIQKLQEE